MVCTTITISAPSSKTWTIKGEKGLTGTVELPAGYGLLWHLVLPNGTRKDLYYGSPTAIPYTYVDSSGRDQMAVIDNEWAFLDHDYTGDLGEISVPVSQVTTSFPNGTTFTGRLVLLPSFVITGITATSTIPGTIDVIITSTGAGAAKLTIDDVVRWSGYVDGKAIMQFTGVAAGVHTICAVAV